MDLLIMKTNDQEGTIMLSKKRIDAIKGWEDIGAAMDAEESSPARSQKLLRAA